MKIDPENINFTKGDGLIPAIIKDNTKGQILMLGYMNREAYKITCDTGKVTFFSRSRNKLWTKGETSGNYLNLVDIKLDCDGDTLLVTVHPDGEVCHNGTYTCWGEERKMQEESFLYELEKIITDRLQNNAPDSYTAKLAMKGVHKVAQKVGEEAVEVVIEALRNNKELLLQESADLLYHLLILLHMNNSSLAEIEQVLYNRHIQSR